MIKYDENKKECIITGEENTIRNEFSIICFGLLKGGFEADDLFMTLDTTIEIFREKEKEKK